MLFILEQQICDGYSIENALFGCLDNERFETFGDFDADFRNLIGRQEEAKCTLITQLHSAGEWNIFNAIGPVLGGARDNVCKVNEAEVNDISSLPKSRSTFQLFTSILTVQ